MTVRLPAEWEPQSGVMLTWPHARGDFAPHLVEVERVFACIGAQVTHRERLIVVCADAEHRGHVREFLARAGADMTRVRAHAVPSNDVWARDHGPITVLDDGRPRMLDFAFNAWGLKYPGFHDNLITRRLVAAGAFGETSCSTVGLVLEGGGIESDGAGTLLVTAPCLLQANRNPHLDRAGVEAELRLRLGVTRVLWLEHGHLDGDDTDGHIDTLARFCDERTIAYQACDDPSDPHHAELSAMAAELPALCTASGAPYRLVALPWPRPRYDEEHRRLPATYANFLIINDAVLVPTYDDPADATALALLADCFPGREIVGIDCLPLIWQYGSLHCVTMQLPAGVVP